MSEYRREDTASWDAQEVRRAQEGRQSAPARHPQSHHTRRRRRNPVLGLGGYLLFVPQNAILVSKLNPDTKGIDEE